MTQVKCGDCHEYYRLLPDDVSLEIFPRAPFSIMRAQCAHCGAVTRFRMPTMIASWLSWAGVLSECGIDDVEIRQYLASLEDDTAMQAEIDMLRNPDL